MSHEEMHSPEEKEGSVDFFVRFGEKLAERAKNLGREQEIRDKVSRMVAENQNIAEKYHAREVSFQETVVAQDKLFEELFELVADLGSSK